MKKLILPALLAVALPAAAAIEFSMPANPTATIQVIETPIGSDSVVAETSITLKEGKARYVPTSLNPASVVFSGDGNRLATVFSANPKENLTVIVPADENPVYGGSELMDAINTMNLAVAPYDKRFKELRILFQSQPDSAQAEFDKVLVKYFDVFRNYIKENPNSPAAAYALLNLDADEFMAGYEALTPQARQSILMPLVEQQKAGVEEQMAREQRIKDMQNGTFAAPAFTLPGTDGKMVSLSDFRGKWVVLDFWGSWCRWCIKGFPALKRAYGENGAERRFEVIGIDNRDPKDRWLEAVKKYQLPWVNVYNDTETEAGQALLESYAVQGFPTKIVIDPQGIIRNITVGEDPLFFITLEDLLSGK